MKQSINRSKFLREILITGLVAGGIVSITYPLQISNRFSFTTQMIMEFTQGPLMIIASLGLYYFIKIQEESLHNILGLIFNSLAALSVTMMLTVQRSVFTMGKTYREEQDEAVKEMIRHSFQSGNLTQLGMDMCFDVFISLGTAFIGLAIWRQRWISKWLALPGVIVGFGGLTINMITFPIPPHDLDLFDPGPYFGIYFAIVLIAMGHSLFIKKHIQSLSS